MKYFALLGVLALVVACGSKNPVNTYVPPDNGGASSVGGRAAHGGSGGSGGKAGTGGAGNGGSAGTTAGGSGGETGGDAGDANSPSPTVKITSPVSVADPNVGPVVTTNPVQVLCDVAPSTSAGATLDTQTVKIQAFDMKGAPISVSATASTQNPNDPNEYGAAVSLAGIPNGPISFKCSVADKSTPPNITTSSLDTFVDQGPTITPVSPLPNKAFSLKNKVLFKFTVTPAPLADNDTLAAVDMTPGKVTLRVDDQVISLTTAQDSIDPTLYSVNVDLNDPVQFPKTPTGTVPVQITAWNERGTQAKLPYTVVIDGTPPVIQIVSPTTGQVVGGHVTLEFTVTDGQSGVDPLSVNIALNNLPPVVYDPQPLSGWSVSADGKTFDYGFESNSSDINGAVQVHVEIKAADNATNLSAGATEDLYLDNHPPIVDLDPPLLQERRFQSGTTYVCSEPFDPLGTSPNDLAVVDSAGIYRALVWDVGNGADGLSVAHLAGTDRSSVILYAQSDPGTPLLIAKHNNSGICDDLASDAVAKPPLENLVPIAPTGASFFDAAAPKIAGHCGAGSDASAPLKLCAANASDLTRVIDESSVGAAEPAIYAIKSLAAQECTGQNWVLPDAGLPNGWICLAGIAKDGVGNIGISAPLRVCLNSKLPGKVPPPCSYSSTTPPICTDGCTPPGHFIPIDSDNDLHVLDLPK